MPTARHRSALAMMTALALSSATLADVIDTTWLGGTGSWDDPTKWSGGVVPNNSGTTTFRVDISSGAVDAAWSAAGLVVDSVNISAGAALTGTAGLRAAAGTMNVDGTAYLLGGYSLAGAGMVSGSGTITLHNVYQYTTLAGDASLEIGPGLTIRSPKHGQIGSPSTPTVNRGRIVGGHDDPWEVPIVRGSTISNLGVIEADKYLAVGQGATFTRADLGNLAWGSNGTILLHGTLLNQGQTLVSDASHRWGILGGTIRGGTLEVASGATFEAGNIFNTARLDDVFVRGRVTCRGMVDVTDGTLRGDGTMVLNPGPDAIAMVMSSSPSLTISATATVEVGWDWFNWWGNNPSRLGNDNGPVTNHGRVATGRGSDARNDLTVYATALHNDGELSVFTNATLQVMRFGWPAPPPCDLTFGPGGTLESFLGNTTTTGLLDVTGALDLTTPGDRLILSANAQTQLGVFYRIARAGGGVLGTFEFVSPGYEVSYTSTEIFARLVPEPTALLPTFAGFALLLFARRARRIEHA